MSRKFLAGLAVALLGGSIVGTVNAQDFGGTSNQESSRRTSRRSVAERLQSTRQLGTTNTTIPSRQIAAPPTPQAIAPQLAPSQTSNTATPMPKPASGLPSDSFSSRRLTPQATPAPPATQRSTGLGKVPSSVLLNSRAPNLRVEGAGPPAIIAGEPANYVINLRNDGTQDAGEVVVSLAIPSSVTLTGVNASAGAPQKQQDASGLRVIWQVPSVPAKSVQQMAIILTPKTAAPFELAIDWAFRPATAKARVEVLQPKLAMRLVGPKEIEYGSTQKYSIVLSNPGTGDAQNVRLALASVSLGQAPTEAKLVGMIPAGGQREFEIELQAQQAGALEIRANASGDGGLSAEIAQQVIVRRPDIKIGVRSPRLVYAPSSANYEVNISNAGDATAKELVAEITLPTGAKYLGGVEGAVRTPTGVKLPIGLLPAGAQRTFALNCELTSEGRNALQVQVRAAGGIATSALGVTQVETIADIYLAVKDPKGPIPVGQKVEYEITVLNRGTKAAQGVQVKAEFSEGITPQGSAGLPATISPGLATFQAIDRLDPEESVTFKVFAVGTVAGNQLFRAEVQCADPETREVKEGTTRFFGESVVQQGEAATTVGGLPPATNNNVFGR